MSSDVASVDPKADLARASLWDALAQLRLKLLDLTGRNRLLNFKHTAGRSLQFVEGDPAAIYERLVEGNNRPTIAIQGLPEPQRREWAERNGRLTRPDPREWARQYGIPTSYDLPERSDASAASVRALFYQDDLAKHCRKLDREATLAIEETGSNMLFLVLGFLDYPDQRDSDRIFSAPLISIPVALSKKETGGKQTFYIQYTGEDITDNTSLREKLKNDFGIIFPALFDEERANDDAVDIAEYFRKVGQVIKDRPLFSVRKRLSLALLSFTNMLLVRDLDPKKWPQVGGLHTLIDHPIVRRIFGTQVDDAGYGDDEATDHPVEAGAGAKVQLVFDADSSQHSALVDVLYEKKNVVIEGPPGTGKSQTITNLIASSIAEGKRVLFVAEKLAALDVVRTRLASAGLSPFLLELHSNKTSKKKVLEELNARLNCQTQMPPDLSLRLEKLESLRRELKQYADMINSIAHNRLALTVHELMWRAERHRSLVTVGEATLFALSVPEAGELSQYELARRVDALTHLGVQFEATEGFNAESAFWGFEPETLVPGDENKLEELFVSAIPWAQALADDARGYAKLLDAAPIGVNLKEAQDHLAALSALKGRMADGVPLNLLPALLASDGTGVRSKGLLQELSGRIARYQALAPVAASGVKTEEAVTPERLEAMRELSQAAIRLGIELSSTMEMAEQLAKLQSAMQPLADASQTIVEFCARRRMPFDNSIANLGRLTELSRLVAQLPEASLFVQRPELSRDGAVHEITRLKELQDQWREAKEKVSQALYADILPSEQALDEAIVTLRQGDAWHRIFDRRWRAAVALHNGLQRHRQKASAKERLGQLEDVRALKQVRTRLDTDGAWPSYLGMSAPAEFFPLDDHLIVARWNREMLAALDEMGVADISIVDLGPEKARALRREFAELGTAVNTTTKSLDQLREALPNLAHSNDAKTIDGVQRSANAFSAALGAELQWIQTYCPAQKTFQDCLAGCEAALERSEITVELERSSELAGLLGANYRGTQTNVHELGAVLGFGNEVIASGLTAQAKRLITSSDPVTTIETLRVSLSRILAGLEQAAAFEGALSKYGEFDLEAWAGLAPESDIHAFALGLARKLDRAAANAENLMSWASYVARRNEVGALGLGTFRSRLESADAAPAELADVYAYCVYASIVRDLFRHVPELGKFAGLKHNQIRDEFKRLDRETIQVRGKAIAAGMRNRAYPPHGANGPKVDDKTEMVLLHYLLPQQRPRMPVRKMMARAGASIQTLKPCS